MYKYVKDIDENGKCSSVGTGTNTEFYKSIGMVRKDVEQSEIDGQWYIANKCPHYSDDEKLNNAKTIKLQELDQKSSAFEQTENKEMYIVSSLGYKVNADPKALRNIEVLIDIGITQFRNYDNETVEVTTDNLKTIKSEIGINTVRLYQQKWTFEDLINKAKTKEELDAIEIKFTMKDFSKNNE